jgi:hypothetical protein
MCTYNVKKTNIDKAIGFKVLMRNKKTNQLSTIGHYLYKKAVNQDQFGFLFFDNKEDAKELSRLLGGKDKCPFPNMEYVIYKIEAENITEKGYSLCNKEDAELISLSEEEMMIALKNRKDNTLKGQKIKLKEEITD